MKTKILGLLVLLLIIGGVAYMLNNKSADKVVDKGLESSTQLAPGENTEQVVDTRTPD